MAEIIKFFFRLLLLLVIPALVSVLTYFYMRSLFFEPVAPEDSTKVLVEVRAGQSFKAISQELAEKGLIGNWRVLSVINRFRKAKIEKIDQGEYELSPNMTPREILEKLASGEVFLRTIEVKPGSSIWELGTVLEAQGLVNETEFNAALSNPDLLTAAGIGRADSFEGHFYPGTYNFSKTDSIRRLIWIMIEEAEKNWPKEYTVRADELDLSRYEILTLASIIEKEAPKNEDKPITSSVFHNRLNNGMKLEADSTVIYGLQEFDGSLSEDDLRDPHLYNTHFNYGLPRGPICNPGPEAIEAALYPQENTYLFYVKDGKGGLVFAKTHKEQEENLKKYRDFNKLEK